MIREYIERRRVRKILAKCVSEEVVDKILSGESLATDLKEGRLEFVLAAVSDGTPEGISKRMGTVCDIAMEYNWVVDNCVSSLIVLTYGMFPFHSNAKEAARLNLVRALEHSLAGNIKILHGVGDCHFGNLGSKNRMSFSFILPGFLHALETLSQMNFGETKQIEFT